MDQVKFVEDSLKRLSRLYQFKFFKGCVFNNVFLVYSCNLEPNESPLFLDQLSRQCFEVHKGNNIKLG